MNWSDYEMIWKRQKPPVGAMADVTDLKASLESKRRKLYAALLVRDYSEVATGVLVSISFASIWWKLGTKGWSIGITLLLILGVCGVFIRERIRIRHHQVGADATVLAKLEAYLAELRHQRRLLLGIWKWYLGPLGLAMVIFGATVRHSRPPWDISRAPIFMICFGIFNAFLFWFAWEINRRTVRKQIEPRITELEKLRDNFISSL